LHPVTELIRARVLSCSKPLHRADGYRVGLAIEGGGMRGVLSAGMLLGMDYLGCTDAFDVVYGSSAGAINAAWLLARQGAYAATVYYDNASTRRFINFWRLFTGRPVLSLEYLLDQVMIHDKVMDWRTVLDSPIELKIIASSLDDHCSEVLSGFESRDQLWEALRASARMPILAGPPVEIGDRSYVDAMLYESIPYRTALEDGCTHVLVVRTRPPGAHPKPVSPAVRLATLGLIGLLDPQIKSAMVKRTDHYIRDVAELARLEEQGGDGALVHSIYPPAETADFERVEISRDRLLAAAIASMRSSIEDFTGRTPEIHQVLRPYWSDGEDVTL
jgi:predicted patatin/cPLA2 family phospholipase